MHIFLFLQRLIDTLKPEIAHAQISGVIGTVGNGLLVFGGFTSIAGGIVGVVDLLLLPVGIFIVVRSGLTLVISEKEDKLSKAKRIIASTLVGIVLVLISQSLVAAFVNISSVGLPSNGPGILAVEVDGIISWITVLVAVIGALMVIVSGVRIIASFGKEEGVAALRRAVFAVAAGILLIMLRFVIAATIGATATPNPTTIIGSVMVIVANLMLFLALVVIIVIIYAAILMMLNFGTEEQFTKARTLIVRALIGLLVIVVSYSFAVFIVNLVG